MPEDAEHAPTETYRLTLYVAGSGPVMERLAERIRRWLCARNIAFDLDTVDVLEDVDRAMRDRVWATPTLIRSAPGPERRFIGEISATNEVMRLLQMPDSD